MKILFNLFILFSILLMGNIEAQSADEYTTTYAKLLSKYSFNSEKNNIKTVLVNYKLWGKDPLHSQTLKKLEEVNPDKLEGNKKKAFWINAYNLLTIDLIIKNNEKETIKNLGSLFKNPWKSYSWKINNKAYSLDKIENKILRTMGDPRIHMSINCASLSCPDILNEPYTAKKLDSQLNKQAKNFLNNSTKGLKLEGSKLKLSKIFKWFKKDFGDDSAIIKFIKTNIDVNIPDDAEVSEYFDYNWDLNSTD